MQTDGLPLNVKIEDLLVQSVIVQRGSNGRSVVRINVMHQHLGHIGVLRQEVPAHCVSVYS